MTSIIPSSEIQVIQNMPEVEASNAAAQMIGLLSAIVQDKNDIDNMVLMLERQPWYKKCIYTIMGKNKATVADIQRHRDKLAFYTSEAVGLLYSSSRMQQSSIIALGEAVNMINGMLASTNVQLLDTQNSIAAIKNETINALRNLGNSLNTKIESVDNYHLLIEEINQGKYNYNNKMVEMFFVLAQIDQRTITNTRKLDILINALNNHGVIDDHERQLKDYLLMLSKTPDEFIGIIYQQIACRDNNVFFELFAELFEEYVFLSKIEKKAKNPTTIVDSICCENGMDPSSTFATNELFQFFLDSKKQAVIDTTSILRTVASSQVSENVDVKNESQSVSTEIKDDQIYEIRTERVSPRRSSSPVVISSINPPPNMNGHTISTTSRIIDGVTTLSRAQIENIMSFPNYYREDEQWIYYIKFKPLDRREALASWQRYGGCRLTGELYKVHHDGTDNKRIFKERVCAEENAVKYRFKLEGKKLLFRDSNHNDRAIMIEST